MRIKCAKPNISEYSFLRLYASTMMIQGQSPIIENHQLEKNLYGFYDESKYHFLFEDIIKKEDPINQENNHVDLSEAFQTAYAWGLLTMIQDSSDLRSIINFSQEEAQNILSQFELKQVNAMGSLCAKIAELKIPTKGNMLIKKRKINTHVH